MIKNKRILILAPHTDDGELGCGGTVSKLIGSNELYYLAFSACEQSVPEHLPKDILKEEVKAATAVLGIQNQNLTLLNYEVRKFNLVRQEILDDLLRLKKEIRPDVVFMPASSDVHQDHQIITNEGLRAFKHSTVLGYELPWNNISFNPTCYISLTKYEVAKKNEAIKAYQSQSHRSYMNEDFINSLAKVRGVQCGVDFAEAFEVIRWII